MVARHHRRRWGCFMGPMGIGEAGGDAGGGVQQLSLVRRAFGRACLPLALIQSARKARGPEGPAR